MNKHCFYILSVLILTLASCSEEREAKQFAKNFAYAINSEDTIAVEKMLDPSIGFLWNYVSFNEVDPDSIQITKQEDGYTALSCDSTIMIISKKEKGFVIKSTRNIILSDRSKVRFALSKGLLNDQMDDKQIYDAIHSKQYQVFVDERKEQEKFAASIASYQKEIPALLDEFEKTLSMISDNIREDDDPNRDPDSLPFLATNIGMKCMLRADTYYEELKKHEKYMAKDQLSRFELANKRLSQFHNLQQAL